VCPVGGLPGNLDFSHGAVPKNIHTYPKERFSGFLEIPQRGLKNYSNNYCKSMNQNWIFQRDERVQTKK